MTDQQTPIGGSLRDRPLLGFADVPIILRKGGDLPMQNDERGQIGDGLVGRRFLIRNVDLDKVRIEPTKKPTDGAQTTGPRDPDLYIAMPPDKDGSLIFKRYYDVGKEDWQAIIDHLQERRDRHVLVLPLRELPDGESVALRASGPMVGIT